ncbi:L-glutamate gamma-semialdehyde dehydrogenase [Sedimentibacter sp. zth1]|uniref:L-glutamate gamma-semialdehyde dehydrogenase n=1 Tax=Sedimentibacter sp. zth1 TaxID=2816908 RepID=UPI001A933D58|nr:L-glutamate gamma-semialdehyde dehydrogenase [Sedimentibacter sp. zth1]QSX06987.1 L-glutamate gamma-semialdehyde dehydrogenase [Sedimentibacter sp. zth1]
MNNGIFTINDFKNEPILNYSIGSKERKELETKLMELKNNNIEIPLIIGGKEIKTNNTKKCIIPYDKNKSIGFYHIAGEKEINMAIEAAMEAKEKWQNMNYDRRMLVFLKAAKLASTTWRATLNAATMLCQSKTFYQAEIDSACELIDFFNANCKALCDIYKMQPMNGVDSVNRVDYRPLDGFVYAITPFNFTAIASNLISAPAMAGNTVVWKPASSAVYSAYVVLKLLQAAGLPDGVINFIPGNASEISNIVMENENLAGVHFTGSTNVFNSMWTAVGKNISTYKSYPRLVGETGGKNFCMVHNTADIDTVVAALIRGSFEYQGQKCSATSRAYIPESMWTKIKEKLISEISTIKMGDAETRENLMSAVIDEKSYKKIKTYIEYTKNSSEAEIICGGKYDDSIGFFVEPTVIVTTNPYFKTMIEEIFGPVLTIFVYDDNSFYETLDNCAKSSKYALTGSIISNDKNVLNNAEDILQFSAGNLYINDKSTGSVVGQNPFGGSKASGTNDKAGSIINMLKWVSPRSIKETFTPTSNYRYQNML